MPKPPTPEEIIIGILNQQMIVLNNIALTLITISSKLDEISVKISSMSPSDLSIIHAKLNELIKVIQNIGFLY